MRFCKILILVLFCMTLVTVFGCNDTPDEPTADREQNTTEPIQQPQLPTEMTQVERLVSSEELILKLTQKMPAFNRSAMNLQLPDVQISNLFNESIQLADLGEISRRAPASDFVSVSHWKVTPAARRDSASIWKPFFDSVSYLKTAKFYFVDGWVSTDTKHFDATMGFASHFIDNRSMHGHAKAKIHVRWQLNDNLDSAKISSWQTQSFTCTYSEDQLFEEVTRAVIGDDLANLLGRSIHEETTTKLIKGQPIKPPADQQYKLFFPEVTLEHPAVSVVDFDSDGLDDFFLGRIHAPSLMFRNQGDGTFAEVAGKIGLSIPNDCTCALFADFDNDSDQDVFIGRARNRALYFKNNDGVYTNAPNVAANLELPYMVSSIAAADYNRDGLLDVYFSTYSPIEGSHASVLRDGNQWPLHFLSTIEQVDFEERRKSAHAYLNMAGPPNLLLENRGNDFGFSKFSFDVECWRKTFQSSWCDYDQDGDPDLYVCNDFAPDDLFRNDQANGFTRISDEIGLSRIGFGMGVSWQDHNNDGHFDLYVSNMYSKAGTRITKQFDELDPRFKQLASGNYLYQFNGDKFELASSVGTNKTVSETGWSWGGQMNDLDNDGNHDIVVANGYYSVPSEVEIKVDL